VLTAAEHAVEFPGGEPIVPEPVSEAAKDAASAAYDVEVAAATGQPLTKAQKAKARRDAKRAQMQNDPALQAARETAEAAVLAQPVEGKGKKAKGKKAPKVDRGSVIRRKR
jgi:hypothetical protein